MSQPLPRDKTGRVNWQCPTLRKRVRISLSQGRSLPKIADALGVPLHDLWVACKQFQINQPPPHWMFASEVALEAETSRSTVRKYARADGVARPWGSLLIVPRKWGKAFAQQWRERHPEILGEPPSGYVSIAQIAEMWGQAKTTVHHKIPKLGIPYVRVREDGVVRSYYPVDAVQRHAPMRYRSRPKGLLTREALADVIGIQPCTIDAWRQQADFPAAPWRASNNNSLLYDPQVTLRWLEGRRMTSRNAAFIERVRAYLNQQQEAA